MQGRFFQTTHPLHTLSGHVDSLQCSLQATICISMDASRITTLHESNPTLQYSQVLKDATLKLEDMERGCELMELV